MFELANVVKGLIIATEVTNFVLPQSKLMYDRLFLAHQGSLQITHELICHGVKINVKVDIVASLALFLHLG